MATVQRIVVDERERQSGVPEFLSELGIRIYYSKLDVADYVVSPDVAVERKTIRDFVSSIYDSRLFYQAERLSLSYSKPYLIVEGDITTLESEVKNKKSYFGAIASVTLNYNMRIVHSLDPSQTALMLYELLKHSSHHPKVFSFEKPIKTKDVVRQQVYLISSLPGIGRKLAERLLLKYGTPRKILSLQKSELAMIKGIGWKRAENISRLLDTSYEKYQEHDKQMSLEI
jgi:DNA excision repair protein ERCC-4